MLDLHASLRSERPPPGVIDGGPRWSSSSAGLLAGGPDGVGDTREATGSERAQLERLGISVVRQAELVNEPARAARRARALLAPAPFVVHVDVDVLDFLDAPLAENVNGRISGPTLYQLGQALAPPVQDDDCWALSLGQLDPNHAEAEATALPRLIDALVASSTGRSTG